MGAAPIRVLLVDDERDFLQSLAQRLTLRNLDVLTATSGSEALDVLDREQVEVVVLDVRMPGMDGIETLKRIRQGHTGVEVVMLTGHADLESSIEGMRLGFFDYLTKPVDIAQLVAKIHDARRRGRGEDVAEETTFGGKLKHLMTAADRLATLGEMAASLAHEINNPLAIISEATGWLKSRVEREQDLPPDLRDAFTLAVGKIETGIDRARRVSRNLLRFAGGANAVIDDVDVGDLAAEVVELTAKTAALSEVKVVVTVEPGCCTVLRIDRHQLRQVLLNLVTNALHAVDRGGLLRLAIAGDDAQVSVEVADDGSGISEENLERIFEPFFTTKSEDRGTGLGLAVSRGIVEKMGGRIEVRSRLGEGSTFTVVLPRRQAAAVATDGQ